MYILICSVLVMSVFTPTVCRRTQCEQEQFVRSPNLNANRALS